MLKNLIFKEAANKILCLFIVSLLLDIFISDFLANLLYLYTLFTIFVYRNTSKKDLNNTNILSPINGTISAIDYKKSKTILYIDVCIFSQHSFLSPTNTRFLAYKKRSGINLDTNNLLSKELNNRFDFNLDKLHITLLEDSLSMQTFINSDKTSFKQGEQIAIFTSGKVIITLPKNVKTTLTLGQKVYSAKTIIS